MTYSKLIDRPQPSLPSQSGLRGVTISQRLDHNVHNFSKNSFLPAIAPTPLNLSVRQLLQNTLTVHYLDLSHQTFYCVSWAFFWKAKHTFPYFLILAISWVVQNPPPLLLGRLDEWPWVIRWIRVPGDFWWGYQYLCPHDIRWVCRNFLSILYIYRENYWQYLY